MIEPTTVQDLEDRPLAAGGLIGPPAADAPPFLRNCACTFRLPPEMLARVSDVPRLELDVELRTVPLDHVAIRQLLQLAFRRRAD